MLLGFTEFYRVLSSFTELSGVFKVFLRGFLSVTGFYRVLPSFTEFYRVLPSLTE